MENTMMTMITESRATVRPLSATGLLATIADWLSAHRRGRDMLRDLEAMEDHMLKDIGLSRLDVMQASAAEPGTDRIAMLSRARGRRMA